ncbi:head decoration protein [Acetobacter orientalis]|uniref:head decoration protein n=1 Tax=Acetobacter orientalis TaxID=146474 RepID=UPI0039E8F7A9
MVSPVLNEHFYTGAFLVREANGYLSRDKGELVNETSADTSYEGGLVLSDASTVVADFVVGGSNTGNGTVGAITVANGTTPSNYTVLFTDPTNFTVSAPDGSELGSGTVGTALTLAGLSFTITAGSTAFVAGDTFTIVVVPGGPKQFVPYTGANPAAAILFDRVYVGAETARHVTVVSRMAEVNGSELCWDPAVTTSENVAALQAQALNALAVAGIVAR